MIFFKNIFLTLVLSTFLMVSNGDGDVLASASIREKGSYDNSLIVNATSSTNTTNKPALVLQRNVSSSVIPVASEGGDVITPTIKSHKGREDVLENPVLVTTTSTNKSNETNSMHTKRPQDNKPVKETVISLSDVPPQQDDSKPIVSKKGVSFDNKTNEIKSNINNNSTNTTVKKVPDISNQTASINATVIHKKPLFTETDSDFINRSESKEEASKQPLSESISVDQIDPLLVDKKSKRSDYIVPIVAVILSVPLVAIVASILYKRGTDWWQHRNYKRMDFLIEGMYHN